MIYVKENQYTEEDILANNEHSSLFDEFLTILGEKIKLKGFDRYKGGLDTVHDLTGTSSVFTHWRGIEIMFHVSTLLPFEQSDPQKVHKLIVQTSISHIFYLSLCENRTSYHTVFFIIFANHILKYCHLHMTNWSPNY